jgi:hypothetical protein
LFEVVEELSSELTYGEGSGSARCTVRADLRHVETQRDGTQPRALAPRCTGT